MAHLDYDLLSAGQITCNFKMKANNIIVVATFSVVLQLKSAVSWMLVISCL